MIDYHIHTNKVDGDMSPEEIINLAKKTQVKIAITEHIRRNPTYNWFEFRDHIKRLDKSILVGVEAKVLDADGTLDVPENIRVEADLVLGSVHSVGTVEWLLNSSCDVIAHPQITQANVDLFRKCGKVLEINALHRLPWDILDQLIDENTFSFGSDTHRSIDFLHGQEYYLQVQNRYKKIRLLS